MGFWQQLLAIGFGVMLLFMVAPGLKQAIAKSKNAEESHWGTVVLLAIVVTAFVMLMIFSVQ